VLVAFLLVLLAQADYFSKNLDVEAIALGFRIDFPFGLGQFVDLVIDLLNALNDRSQLVTRYVNWPAHGLLLVNMTVQKSDLQRERERSTYIFVSERGAPLSVAGYQRMVARAGVAAGFPFLIHSHMLRHSSGYKLANDGHDTRAIQGYLGH
jgi:hypothetical protein